jgi:hypothetical protein
MADSNRWARSLRVIGQEVSKFKPVFLQVELVGDEFVVRGGPTACALDSSSSGMRHDPKPGFRLLDKNPSRVSNLSPCKPFVLIYTPASLAMLDQEWARSRRAVSKGPDLYSLPELLRTVGGCLDSEEGSLVKLTKEGQTVVLHFKDKLGNAKALQCSMSVLYRKQREMVSKRQSLRFSNAWELHRL